MSLQQSLRKKYQKKRRTYNSFDGLVLMNDWFLASVIVQFSFFALLVFFIAKEVRKRPKNLWLKLFVE
jgi:hypothetical protein